MGQAVVILFGILGWVEKDLGSNAAEGEHQTNGRSASRDGSSSLDWSKKSV